MSTYTILKSREAGRYVVASRNISAGEVIFCEKPFAVGPKADSQPVCLGCYASIEGTAGGPRCPRCYWPMCVTCVQSSPPPLRHEQECAVFSTSKIRFQDVADNTAICPQFDCITPLRVLLAMEAYPDRWRTEVNIMEYHPSRRRGSASWCVDKVNVAGFLRGPCKLDRFSEELVLKVCGILEVNAFEARTVNGYSVRCLFPKLAILSHNCVPNTTHAIVPSEDFRVTVRTTTSVLQNTELHSCYTYTLMPTIWRQKHLWEGKFFRCRCARCSDPSELGTHMGTLKCQICTDGYVLTTDPLNPAAIWRCNTCGATVDSDNVVNNLQMLQTEMENLDESGCNIQAREELLKKFTSVLHPQHSLVISMLHSLPQLYGRASGYQLSQMTMNQLHRKVDLCKTLLKVLNVIEPGYSRIRAMTMYELHSPLIMLAKLSAASVDNKSKTSFKAVLKEACKLLLESSLILGWEDCKSPEGIIGQVAKQMLKKTEEQIKY